MPATGIDRLYGLTTSVAVKPAVVISADTHIQPYGEQTITTTTFTGTRTIITTEGMRILLTNQNDPVDNGIWEVKRATWVRSKDFNGPRDVVNGTLVFSITGDCWQVEALDPVIIGTSEIQFRSTYPFSPDANLFQRSLRVPEAFIQEMPPLDQMEGKLVAIAGGKPVGVLPESGSAAEVLIALAKPDGAGMVGYDSGETYAPGTVGDEIGPYEATDADNKYGRKDRARRHLSAVDFGDSDTDIGAAVNLATASLATEYNPSATENIRGGEVELPRGTHTLLTPISLEKHASGITGLRIIGQGQSTSELDMTGAAALSDGVAANTNGASFFRLQDFNVKSAPRRSVSLNKYSRGFISGVQSESAGADGFYFGNGIVMCIDNIMSHASVSNGVRFNPGTVSDPLPGFQHTSHSVRAGYVSNSQGDGWLWGFMNYSNGVACAADNCTRYGHLIERCNGFSLDAPGAETNGRSGIGAISSATVGTNKATIRDAFMYSNNTSNGGFPNCLHVIAQDGVKNEITLLDSVSVPAVGDTTPCVLVDGIGAEVTMNRQTLPNGWKTQNGGYIRWIHDTLLVKNITIPVSTATPVCNTISTQGHKTRYGGTVTVMASNQPPSTPDRNTSLYHLLINKSIGAGSQVIEIAQSGHVSGGGSSLPSFTWTLVNDQLVATPMTGVGGVPFWFEVTTDSQIVAMPL